MGGEESDFQSCHITLLKMSSVQRKTMTWKKKQESMAHTLRTKQAIETVPEEILTLNLLGKDFKSAITNMLKVVKKIMPQQLSETMSHQIESINR